jgi:hypothetical protein
MRLTSNKLHSRAGRAALRHVRKSLCTRVRQVQAEADDNFIRNFPAMIAAVEAGLRHEEAILDMLRFRRLRERRAENAMILCALHRASIGVEVGDVELGRRLVAALADVLELHRMLNVPMPTPFRAPRARGRRLRPLQ